MEIDLICICGLDTMFLYLFHSRPNVCVVSIYMKMFLLPRTTRS